MSHRSPSPVDIAANEIDDLSLRSSASVNPTVPDSVEVPSNHPSDYGPGAMVLLSSMNPVSMTSDMTPSSNVNSDPELESEYLQVDSYNPDGEFYASLLAETHSEIQGAINRAKDRGKDHGSPYGMIDWDSEETTQDLDRMVENHVKILCQKVKDKITSDIESGISLDKREFIHAVSGYATYNNCQRVVSIAVDWNTWNTKYGKSDAEHTASVAMKWIEGGEKGTGSGIGDSLKLRNPHTASVFKVE